MPRLQKEQPPQVKARATRSASATCGPSAGYGAPRPLGRACAVDWSLIRWEGSTQSLGAPVSCPQNFNTKLYKKLGRRTNSNATQQIVRAELGYPRPHRQSKEPGNRNLVAQPRNTLPRLAALDNPCPRETEKTIESMHFRSFLADRSPAESLNYSTFSACVTPLIFLRLGITSILCFQQVRRISTRLAPPIRTASCLSPRASSTHHIELAIYLSMLLMTTVTVRRTA